MGDAWTLFFDGSCEPWNPGGIASYGFVLQKSAAVVQEGKGLASEPGSPMSTNNVAEYSAMIEGIKAAGERLAAGDSLEVLGDSQLAVRQVNGEYRVNAPHLIGYHAKAAKAVWDLRAKGHPVAVRWIPREQNSHADRLSKQAVEDALRADPEIPKKLRLPFGKFKGRLLSEIPDDYRRWLWTKGGRENPEERRDHATS